METSEERMAENNVWNTILETVEKRLNKQIFDAWFRPIHFEGFDEADKVLHLRANHVTKNWVNTYYSDLLSQTMKELDLRNYKLDWKVEEIDTCQRHIMMKKANFLSNQIIRT